MLNTSELENIIDKVMTGLPEGIKNLPDNLRDNLRMALQGTLSKLDLVSREEFDTQVAVLQRTRQKLDELEQALQDKS